MGKKLEKSEKSSLVGVNFGEFPQGCGGVSKEKGAKKDPHGPVQGRTREQTPTPGWSGHAWSLLQTGSDTPTFDESKKWRQVQ